MNTNGIGHTQNAIVKHNISPDARGGLEGTITIALRKGGANGGGPDLNDSGPGPDGGTQFPPHRAHHGAAPLPKKSLRRTTTTTLRRNNNGDLVCLEPDTEQTIPAPSEDEFTGCVVLAQKPVPPGTKRKGVPAESYFEVFLYVDAHASTTTTKLPSVETNDMCILIVDLPLGMFTLRQDIEDALDGRGAGNVPTGVGP
jgi:hypothetical protein